MIQNTHIDIVTDVGIQSNVDCERSIKPDFVGTSRRRRIKPDIVETSSFQCVQQQARAQFQWKFTSIGTLYKEGLWALQENVLLDTLRQHFRQHFRPFAGCGREARRERRFDQRRDARGALQNAEKDLGQNDVKTCSVLVVVTMKM